jgi:transcription termination factor Rho
MPIETVIVTVVTVVFVLSIAIYYFTPLRKKKFDLNKLVIKPLQQKVANRFTAVGMFNAGNKGSDTKTKKEKTSNTPFVNNIFQDSDDKETQPTIDLTELRKKDIHLLIKLAAEHDIQKANQMSRQELIFALLQSQSKRNVVINASGVLEVVAEGYGFLRSQDYNYDPGRDDIYVSPTLIEHFNLRAGDMINGQVEAPKKRARYYSLKSIEAVNHNAPEVARGKSLFDNFTPQAPHQVFKMEREDGDMISRVIDIVSPIGMGQRGMIQKPENIETSTILQSIATSFSTNHPEADLTMLLINKPPEIITDIQDSTKAEVISACYDKTASQQVRVIEMVLEKAKRQVEYGKHVVILLDSITDLTKAYNLVNSPSDIIPKDLNSNAILKAKSFFGSARSIKGGGSLTIISIIDIHTGSAIDEGIFEELKGLSNMQLVLDSELYNRIIIPSINIQKSFTSNMDALISNNQSQRIFLLKRILSSMSSSDATEFLLDKLKNTKNNKEFFLSMQKES